MMGLAAMLLFIGSLVFVLVRRRVRPNKRLDPQRIQGVL